MTSLPDRPTRRSLVAAAAATILARPSLAQEGYPSRPIRLVVPYPPGGGNDDVARMLAEGVSRGLGHPVVVENRPGASGMLAGEFVSRSAPDGHTIMVDQSSLVMNPALFGRTPFDVQKDLAPITLAVTVGIIVVAHPSLPARNVAELIALAKAQPGRINYASPGNGTPQHIDMEVLKRAAGIDLVHVPYRGGAPATLALLANEAQLLLSGTSAVPHIQAGTMRALATAGLRRSSLLPDVPTVNESGLPGYESGVWIGFFAPARTPAPIIARLNAEFTRVLQGEEMRRRFTEKNMEVVASTPDAFAEVIDRDLGRYTAVIRELGIRPD
ncbi:Bug family tripartite tricarboxylate transporter substrate binding protein [Falsiroseomonas sp. HW251]|uniref:Bug family tripartite tricarboxylate transporter substrate binding protein n=1 Tax=Falsiroseomonas sp. HW251 TaxID=3390998 RepID=UPI003D317F9F